GAALIFSPLSAIWSSLVAILPLFLVLSYLGALQLREFARGEFLRLSLSSAWILFAFTNAAVFARHAPPGTIILIATSALVDAAASLSALTDAFRRRFPGGFVVDVAGAPTRELTALPSPERQAIWRDALRDARRVARARSSSPFVVTSFRPGGTIRLLFVTTR